MRSHAAQSCGGCAAGRSPARNTIARLVPPRTYAARIAVCALEALFTPQAERLQRRMVVDVEQHGFVARRGVLERGRRPRRDRDEVAAPPREALTVHGRDALAAHHVVHRRARVTERRAAEAWTQPD